MVSEIIKKAKNAGIKRGDAAVIALLLLLSAVLMCLSVLGSDDGTLVRVCVDGEQTALLPLDSDAVYEVPGGCGNVVEIIGGRVHMLSAECPDESCVRQGFICRAGECIVCLPGRVTVTVLSEDSEAVLDAVAY